ncbi:predicted protein [Histoplasma mississippiense (nom. inval.)]|uniref:predicted protein n=1 Tax=Ajellomyces capsulatus (strain NAm1 / WU24) TaxID=2059318 RepID=UPI000157B510|nr:predicted protein [Histoplasma mississippiense (nom. inval.)]EDN03063.1 predicted protein [Histoplasma mississippiense (nom. inval.)]
MAGKPSSSSPEPPPPPPEQYLQEEGEVNTSHLRQRRHKSGTIKGIDHTRDYWERQGERPKGIIIAFAYRMTKDKPVIKQMSVIQARDAGFNDTYSYEKQGTSRTGHKEGAFLCSAVKVLAGETKFGVPATKRKVIRIFVFRSQSADGQGFDPVTPLARF